MASTEVSAESLLGIKLGKRSNDAKPNSARAD
jgi:hypothetical protein